ncbi:tRNA (adenosine(37)-N6)-threonylcarbamoyltransferase complex dimerization subunit type 1 TsaB [Metasolibacillus meyeri]|uniref:tRNA (Adenosine(37)-N6)-threonylcarbamoyltransferase complex dimerization subunit type 1 TsaB n=1 Tax=Metasolibacillus meyeri TaxID=1071052 RepID=A0AAW9NY61_9BACL|nr:tRNA (adenosine(37)-N6)-threonylcarbamoyltransferase complex dimerization subunit type 1 TsaB [Metasolibacillus meyeri]MEC1180819.1 tRNA (adenosine(37)-N6)-threonylcarbamoyltransferase complex dimerization subunit type 1 TsaB [Metasolibacillus meyeri]
MIWLGIETANAPLSIALVQGGKIVAEVVQHIKVTHSAGAMPAIEELCAKASIKPAEIDAIAVSEGPGAYTGVRIGVTLAKTLAWTLQKPLVGVSSLQVLAMNGRLFNGVVCPLFDARRQHVYAAIYGRQATVLEDGHYAIADILEQVKQCGEQALFIGEDVVLYKEQIEQALGNQAVFAPFTLNLPRASELVALAMDKELPSIDATHAFVPQYRRIAEAEANWLQAQKENN